MKIIAEKLNILFSLKTIIGLIIVVIILAFLNIKTIINLAHVKQPPKQKVVEQVHQDSSIKIVERDLIFHLPAGTMIKIYSISPLEIEIVNTQNILEKNGTYYYYTTGKFTYILSGNHKKYIRLKNY